MQELYRPDKQPYSALLVEAWLNEVLHVTPPAHVNSNQGPFKVTVLS